MDENKDTKQGGPQTTGQTSGDVKGSTPAPETYTKESQEKAVSDALATAGRTAKALTDRETAVQASETAVKAAEAKVAEAQKAKDAAELEAARSDPDQLSAVQKKQALKAREDALAKSEAELARSKAEHQSDIGAAKTSQVEKKAMEIATQYKVDAATLVKFGGSSPETMEELAKTLVANKTGTTPLLPLTGGTIGGKDLSGLSPKDRKEERDRRLASK